MDNKEAVDLINEILKEIEEEEKEEEARKKIIIQNGCPCIEKVKRIGIYSKLEYLECPICRKQFYLDGTEMIG